MSFTTNGLVCGHHHLYSSLARGMPAPPQTPTSFLSVLENVWWRLDAALDLDIIYWSAALGAAEALLNGTTAIIDHHESPFAIEGSLDVIQSACDMVGISSNLSYGVTDRWVGSSMTSTVSATSKMTDEARRGLAENERFIKSGGRGMVGVHAAFTCSDETLETSADLAQRLNVGVHVHVAEGTDDIEAGSRLQALSQENWLIVHAVHLNQELKGTLAHNPRSNMNNAVGYAYPSTWPNDVILGTDGIGADMLEEVRIAYVRQRETDITASPDDAWNWLRNGEKFFPEVKNDVVTWSYDHSDSPWHVAFTPGIRCESVNRNGELLVSDGKPTKFDMDEIRAKAAEAATKLHERLS